MIGSCYFFGIICGILWIPKFADTHGRVPIIIFAMVGQIMAQSGVYLSSSLRFTQCCMFILGVTFPGKCIVWYNYCMEIIKEDYKQFTVNLIYMMETVAVILVCGFYQHIDNNWKSL